MAHHRLQVSVSRSLYDRLRKAASRSNVAPAVWVHQAIEERLERESRHLPADPLAALRDLEAPTADIDEMIAEIAAGGSRTGKA